jgi:hypothetical protein
MSEKEFCNSYLTPSMSGNGQPFKPDEQQTKILTEGAFAGKAMGSSRSRIGVRLANAIVISAFFRGISPQDQILRVDDRRWMIRRTL